MKLENINIAQALAYQLERAESDLSMLSCKVSFITITTEDGYECKMLASDNEKGSDTVQAIMLEHIAERIEKITKEIIELE